MATKSDQELLWQDVSMIKTQLSALIQMFRGVQHQHPVTANDQSLSSVDHTPPPQKHSDSKRSKVSITPVKMKSLEDDIQDTSVSSTASTTLEERMERREY